MKRKLLTFGIALCIAAAVIAWMGIGPRTSSSAVADLKAELESIYGPETERMRFEIEPRTWFLTNWNLRQSLGLDYVYECKVIYVDEYTVTIRGIDPMGTEEIERRAYLVFD